MPMFVRLTPDPQALTPEGLELPQSYIIRVDEILRVLSYTNRCVVVVRVPGGEHHVQVLEPYERFCSVTNCTA